MGGVERVGATTVRKAREGAEKWAAGTVALSCVRGFGEQKKGDRARGVLGNR